MSNNKKKPNKKKVAEVNKKRFYISKTRWGTYELLNEKQYFTKLFFG